MGLITKLFGTYSERELKSIYPIVDKIEAMADEYRALTDEELRANAFAIVDEVDSILIDAHPLGVEARQIFVDGDDMDALTGSTTFCPKPSPPCARPQAACSGFIPTACSSSAASCSIRGASPR